MPRTWFSCFKCNEVSVVVTVTLTTEYVAVLNAFIDLFDLITMAVAEVGRYVPAIRLISPFGWHLSLQLAVLSRAATVVLSRILWRYECWLVVKVLSRLFVISLSHVSFLLHITEPCLLSCQRLHNCCGEWEGWDPVNRFNNTSWVAVVTPTDRPKSVRNRCVIKVFGSAFMLSLSFLASRDECPGRLCHSPYVRVRVGVGVFAWTKTWTLATTFLLEVIGHSYFKRVFLVTKPFTSYRKFWPRNLEVWSTFEKLKPWP